MKNTPNDQAEAEIIEARLDEAIAESFPASDPPSWTLGMDPDSAIDDITLETEETAYQTRQAILLLLSDDEVARVSTLESSPLPQGEEYIDLAHPHQGVRRAEATTSANQLLARSAVSAETWAELRAQLAHH